MSTPETLAADADPLAQGQQLLLQGDRGGALAAFNRAAAQAHAAADPPRLYLALKQIAKVYLQMGQFDRALPAALASARVAVSLPDVEARLMSLLVAGICRAMLGHPAESNRHFEAALTGARAAGLVSLESACLTNLVLMACFRADELRRAGRDGQALSALRMAGQYVTEGDRLDLPGDEYLVTLWRANRAGWLRRVDRLDEAARDYERVYARAVASDWVDVMRHAALGLALIAGARKQPDKVEPWLVRCIAAGDTLDAFGFINEAHAVLAQWHKERGNHAAAQRHLAHNARLLDTLHATRRNAQEAVAAVEFDIARALGPDAPASA